MNFAAGLPTTTGSESVNPAGLNVRLREHITRLFRGVNQNTAIALYGFLDNWTAISEQRNLLISLMESGKDQEFISYAAVLISGEMASKSLTSDALLRVPFKRSHQDAVLLKRSELSSASPNMSQSIRKHDLQLTMAKTKSKTTFTIAVVGREGVGKSLLIDNLLILHGRTHPGNVQQASGDVLQYQLAEDLFVTKLPSIGQASCPIKEFCDAYQIGGYDLVILIVGNRFREHDQEIIHMVSKPPHPLPLIVLSHAAPATKSILTSRKPSTGVDGEINAYLNRNLYSNVNAFLLTAGTELANRSSWEHDEQLFLDRMNMYYERFRTNQAW
ncbi:uncharacterized protein LOC129589604 [Paramacrobiotus metropolitanus]|uniref:uncharacterized protein LOC129589604 n=1 Tax=Paramacrobiotus metropolitanus TaxID=2943436 RepID=UPI002445D3B4|nr:uncharacterized protein LOC129589604 [Paramacrobiotus metropolitanus]